MRLAEALQSADKAIAIDVSYEKAHYRKALVLKAMGGLTRLKEAL